MQWSVQHANDSERRLALQQAALAEFLAREDVPDDDARRELRAFLIDRRINVSRDEFERWVRQLADEGRRQADEARRPARATRWV
jgi:hypothetical protein